VHARRYLEAVAIVAASVLLRRLLDPWLGPHTPFVFAYPAILLSAWRGGFGPAMFAAALLWFAVAGLILAPLDALFTPAGTVGLGVFAFTATLSAVLGGSLHRARREAEATAKQLATEIIEQQRRAGEVARLQRLELMGRLAGGVAHETNNQMTIVLGFAEMASQDAQLDPSTRAELGEIRNAAVRVAALTRQLLAMGRQQVMRLEVLDLDDVVDETLSVLDRLLGPDVQLQRVSGPGTKTARADETQLVQLLVNLVLNARDAMPHGGPLRIETYGAERLPERRRLGRAFDGRAVVLAVTDAGTGIAPELLDRIFEPFYTTKPPGVGSGLGLSVVEGIVEQTGGDLWVDSEPGRGTTVAIALPLASEAARRPEAEPAPPAGAGRRLLLVEDDAPVRATMEKVLTRAGYRVVCARDAEHALTLVESGEPFDLVVSDVAMAALTGPELAQRCAARAPDLGFVFVSGHPADALGETIPTRRGFVQKPFTPATLASAVAEALGQPPVSTGAALTPPPSARSR
jgi:two-component system cell cycle sensor histidine kinase/response regulator CckA